jgi:high-affinity Fe2+/Pb2+ permease
MPRFSPFKKADRIFWLTTLVIVVTIVLLWLVWWYFERRVAGPVLPAS